MLSLRPLHTLSKVLLTLLLVIFLQPLMVLGCTSDAITELEAQTSFATDWQNVSVGGGGYVTGIYLHPKERDLIYIRTDIGGFFRWRPDNDSWMPLTDNFSLSESNHYGGEALAIDVNNPDVVYIAAGLYLSDGLGAIFKSVNRGSTWTKLSLQLPMGGSEDKRWAGNRLAVDPFNSNLLLFGSRQNGLWRSSDGGLTWAQVTSLSTSPDSTVGVLTVIFDPQVEGRVYASVYDDCIYESINSGVSWKKIDNSPSRAVRMAIAKDSILYVTSDVLPGVSKYSNGAWQDITPKGYSNYVFNGLSTHPTLSQSLIVALGEIGSARIFYSKDGGISWTTKREAIQNTVPWWPDHFFADHPSNIQFDPHLPNRVWLTDWFGIWRTEDIDTNPSTWTNYQQGHEEVVTFTLKSPPEGALLLSGVADVEGFYHQRLDTYPASRLGYGQFIRNYFQDTYSISYSTSSPLNLVRVGGNRWNSTYSGATSTDGGLTWEEFKAFPDNVIPQRVAVSATDPKRFVVTTREDRPLLTMNGGRSWQKILGLPDGEKGPWTWSQPLAADGLNGKRFYYYSKGILYRTDDGGLSFYPINKSLPEENDWYSIQSVANLEEDIWLSLNTRGLYHSIDGGKTFIRVPKVQRAYLFSLGKSPQGHMPVLYVYGTVGELEGIFFSLDQGETWTNISKNDIPIGNKPNVMEASKQQVGLVFIGTTGRGIYYKSVTAQ